MIFLFKRITDFSEKYNLFPEGSKVVLGLSGGPDSVFLFYYLLDLIKQKKITLVVAHLDHEWRKGSDQDEQFCRKLAHEHDIEFVSAKLSELDKKLKKTGSQEELGRKARRYFLQKVCKDTGADLIALAHHLNDQEETFLIRLIRGATLSGLACMRSKYDEYVRPLLSVTKDEILKYLEDKGISYLVDPSNQEDSFLRNRIRNNVLPELHKVDERFDHNFLKTLNNIQETENFLEKLTVSEFDKISLVEDKKTFINLDLFFQLDPFMQKRILLYWMCREKVPFSPSLGLLEEILRVACQQGSKKHQVHQSWFLVKKKNQLCIEKFLKFG